jgi:outer membrane protein assembly factor BamD
MLYTVGTLAQNEVHIARYYFKRGAYLAAINRAQIAISDYREVPALEEALYIIYRSYAALGVTKLRDDAKRILDQNYPTSQFVANGFKGDGDPWWKVW